ncbi:Hypothetical protein NTJ_03220 [Nesidiocoris tenuis]|uniref:Uncharacterized protein n=2 Tax=Nesidiocoris tenuis TaxID=355587 RepID=A0ABN7AJ91_9HEMI|nr:Hypothetical protein NTJ_03220 [Nesidiocoris tenuis]
MQLHDSDSILNRTEGNMTLMRVHVHVISCQASRVMLSYEPFAVLIMAGGANVVIEHAPNVGPNQGIRDRPRFFVYRPLSQLLYHGGGAVFQRTGSTLITRRF